MSPQHSALLQFLNLGDETVRVFSDGVPERDYPVGCQLVVHYGEKGNYVAQENLDVEAMRRNLMALASNPLSVSATRRLPGRLRPHRWFRSPPPHPRQSSLAWPNLVKGLAFIESAVLHYITNRIRVVYILERIRVQHDQIGQFPRLQRSQILLHPDRIRPVHRPDAQHVVIRH